MSKGAYIGVDNVARKIKKGYIGVDGVARKIKKAYIGVGGVARPCWGSGAPESWGTTTELTYQRCSEAYGTSVGNYALFATAGNSNPSFTSYVNAYDSALVKTTASNLSQNRFNMAATSVGSYALFGGGNYWQDSATSKVDAYNESLTRSTPTALSSNMDMHNATSVGNYALFGGGNKAYGIDSDGNGTQTASNVVNAYNASLTRSVPTALSTTRTTRNGAASNGTYALFAGGYYDYDSYGNQVDAYNSSLTRSAAATMSYNRHSVVGARVGNYALFGGGTRYSSGYKYVPNVDAYNASLTRTTATAFPTRANNARMWEQFNGTTLGNYAIFGLYEGIVAYDASLTQTILGQLSTPRYRVAAASVGNYALFAGGSTGSQAGYTAALPNVDVVSI